MPATTSNPFRNTPGPGIIIAATVGILVGIGAGIYFYTAQKYRKDARARLETLAELKLSQIANWRFERLADASVLMESPYMRGQVSEYLNAPTPENEQTIRARLRSMIRHHRYHSVYVTDPNGETLFTTENRSGRGDIPQPGSDMRANIREAAKAGAPVLTDLHRGPGDLPPHIGVIAPIHAPGNEDAPIACIVLRSDAGDFLFPLIQQSPVATRTAETLLVRREGDEVLYLNDLRHRADTMLKLRMPADRSALPAAMASRGVEGPVAGKDYRDRNVLAVLRKVPDTPWYMVAKIDTAEALAELRLASVYTAALLAALLTAGGVGYSSVLQRRAKRHYQRLYRTMEEQLKIEEGHRVTLMGIGDAVISTDDKGRVEIMNPVAEHLTGWPQSEAKGRALPEVFRIINETTREPVEDPVRLVMRERKKIGLAKHTLLLSRRGEEIPIQDSGAPVFDDAGELKGVVLVFSDQTHEREMRGRILEETHKNSRLLESIRDGFLSLDRNLILRYLNPAAERILKRRADDVLNRPLFEAVPEAKGSEFENRYRRVLETGRPDHFEVFFEKEPYRNWYDVRVYPSEEGISVFFLVTTEQKTKQLALEESEKRFRRAIDRAPFPARLHAEDGEILFVNQAWTRTTGYTSEELPRMEDWLRRAYGDPDTLSASFSDALYPRGGKIEERERTLRCHDGSERIWRFRAMPLGPGPDGRRLTLTMAVDDTERRELETRLNLSQKLESVGQLAGGVAHDFNNLLMGIMNYIELCRDRVEDPEVRGWLDDITEQAERTATITHQLLAFARKQAISPQSIDLNETVEVSLKMLRRLIGENIDLEWSPGENIWRVKMDPSQVNQVLTNLAVNGRDAIGGVGRLTIETENTVVDEEYCRTHPEAFAGEFAVLEVSDNGCGMDADTLAHVFEPFFTTKDVGQGTGLGLATVYGITRQNKGFVNVYSEPGEGTTFRIYFPRHDAPPEARETGNNGGSAHTGIQDMPTGGETVLLAEDEESIRLTVSLFLKRLGYDVRAAATPDEALRLCGETERDAIDLLITDVIMPGMNGRELAEAIAGKYPRLKTIYMSGYTENLIVHRGILENDVAFLSKPFSANVLAHKVREVLDGVAE